MRWQFGYEDDAAVMSIIERAVSNTSADVLTHIANGSKSATYVVAVSIFEAINKEAERRERLQDAAEAMHKALEDARELLAEHWPNAGHDQRERDLIEGHRTDALDGINRALARCKPIEF